MDDFSSDNQERRNFYRLNDHIIFDYCVLDANNSETPQLAFDPIVELQSIGHELRELDTENQPHIQAISSRHPNISESLRLVNKKIDTLFNFLSQELIAKFILKIDARETHYVNLSAGGLAFSCAEALTANQVIFCKIILKPSLDCVLTKAEVVACTPQKDTECARPYRVSVKFIDLSHNDEQLIARYIFQKQIHTRQNKEQASHNDLG